MLLVFLLLTAIESFGGNYLFTGECKKYNVIKKIYTHKSFVRVIKTEKGQKYIIKQHRNSYTQNKLNILREIIVSQMAASFAIPVNLVYLLDSKHLLFAKAHKHWPATLHSFVPGKPINKIPGFQKMNILQKWKISRKGQKVSQKNRGLSVSKFKWISLHDDIATIAALDTFVGNDDRVSDHLYYDKKKDRFCGIDLEVAFEHNLCEVMCVQIENCIAGNLYFTAAELTGLKKYRDVLHCLMYSYPPQRFHRMIERLAQEVNLDAENINCFNYKKTFEASYRDCQKLIALLDILFLKYEFYSE